MKKILCLLIPIMLICLCSCSVNDLKTVYNPKANFHETKADKEFLDNNYKDIKKDIEELIKQNKKETNESYKLLNEYRKANKVNVLKFDSALTIIATLRAKEIADSGKFSHHRPDNKGYFSVLYNEYGIDTKVISSGENLARHKSTPQEAFDAWQNSATHNDNMLKSKWSKVGLGSAVAADGTIIWVQEFSE